MPLTLRAQSAQPAPVERAVEQIAEQEEKHEPLLRGLTLSVDVIGIAEKFVADYGGYEGALRVNLKDKYFPTFECGYAFADKTDETTSIHYKTAAPYFRIGMDFNILRNKHQGNRLYAGFRGAFTAYEYDNEAPALTDPVWGGTVSNNIYGVSNSAAWLELVFGLESEITRHFHMGWSVRYKARLTQKSSDYGDPWYVPGFGLNGTTRFGATYNLTFDLPLHRNK